MTLSGTLAKAHIIEAVAILILGGDIHYIGG
jgi:hypothetical protein